MSGKPYYLWQSVFKTSPVILSSGGGGEGDKKTGRKNHASNCCITFLISVLHGRLKAFHRCLLELIRLFGTPSQFPKRQLKCVCKLPHAGQSTAASSPVTTQCFQTPENCLETISLQRQKGLLGGFLSSHPQIGLYSLGVCCQNTEQGC